MKMDKLLANKKLLIAMAGIIILFLIVLLVSLAVGNRDMATLKILVAPTSSNITLNGRKYENGTYEVEAGEYEVKIEKEGFIANEQTIKLEKDKEFLLTFALYANDENIEWYQEHEEDLAILNTIGDRRAEEEARVYIRKYPAITKLPIRHAMYLDGYYDETEFRIDGGWFEGCKSEFCIKITDETHNSYEKAYQALRDNGINPDDYEIIYEYKILTK